MQVRDETDTRIIFPNANDSDRSSITIIGKQEDVEKAKVLLEGQITGLVSVNNITIIFIPPVEWVQFVLYEKYFKRKSDLMEGFY